MTWSRGLSPLKQGTARVSRYDIQRYDDFSFLFMPPPYLMDFTMMSASYVTYGAILSLYLTYDSTTLPNLLLLGFSGVDYGNMRAWQREGDNNRRES